MTDQKSSTELTDSQQTTDQTQTQNENRPNGTSREKAIAFLKLLGAAEAKMLGIDWNTVRKLKRGEPVNIYSKTIERFGGDTVDTSIE